MQIILQHLCRDGPSAAGWRVRGQLAQLFWWQPWRGNGTAVVRVYVMEWVVMLRHDLMHGLRIIPGSPPPVWAPVG